MGENDSFIDLCFKADNKSSLILKFKVSLRPTFSTQLQ